MNNVRNRLIIHAALVASMAVGAMAGDAESAGVRQEIVDAWSARREALQSVRLRWSKVYYSDPSITYLIADLTARKAALAANQPVPEPPKDRSNEPKKVNERGWLVISGDKMRYESDMVRWSGMQHDFIDHHYAAVWNGREGRSLFSKNKDHEYPSGTVHKEQGHTDARMIFLRPLILWCRPLDPLLGALQAEQLEVQEPVSGERGPGGLLVGHPTAYGGRLEMYVDPARSYVVTRFASFDAQNLLRVHGAVEYRHDPRHGWLPSQWEVSKMGKDGLVLEGVKARVDEIAVNVKPADEEFDIIFPAGTWVNDAKRDSSYIVRPSGGKREVSMAERQRGATYAQLAAADSGGALQPGPQPDRQTSYWPAALIGLIGCAGLGGMFAVARVLRRRSQRTGP